MTLPLRLRGPRTSSPASIRTRWYGSSRGPRQRTSNRTISPASSSIARIFPGSSLPRERRRPGAPSSMVVPGRRADAGRRVVASGRQRATAGTRHGGRPGPPTTNCRTCPKAGHGRTHRRRAARECSRCIDWTTRGPRAVAACLSAHPRGRHQLSRLRRPDVRHRTTRRAGRAGRRRGCRRRVGTRAGIVGRAGGGAGRTAGIFFVDVSHRHGWRFPVAR